MVKKTFWLLLGIFVFILCQFFIPPVGDLLRGPFLFLLPFIIFSLGGALLIFLTLKKKVKGNLKKFLLLTGVSALGFFIGVLLHNILYGLGIMVEHITWLSYLLEMLHVIFFIIATIVCPVGFSRSTYTLTISHKQETNSDRK